jgi:hypothetical protein
MSQAGPPLVVATGADDYDAAWWRTAAARQLLRGRSPFRGEWEHIPFFLAFPSKKKEAI